MGHSLLIRPLRRPAEVPRVPVWVTPRRPPSGAVWAGELAAARERLPAPEARDLIRSLARLSVEKPLELRCGCRGGRGCPLSRVARRIRACRRTGDFRLRWVGKVVPREGTWNRP